MYNEQNNRFTNQVSEFNQSASPIPAKRKKRKNGIFKRAAAFVLCAVIFGGLAGGSFYGVNALLGNTETAESQESGATSLSMVSHIHHRQTASRWM